MNDFKMNKKGTKGVKVVITVLNWCKKNTLMCIFFTYMKKYLKIL